MKLSKKSSKSAFSLIELSIVLIIIGLLIAGVTGGASLIKSSELRSIITESRTWSVSVNSFFNQFDSLPGDYDNRLGGQDGGDGDGKIEFNSLANSDLAMDSEGRNAWRHLSVANVLDKSVVYATLNNLILDTSNQADDAITSFGEAIPGSKIGGAAWDFDYSTISGHNVAVLTGSINSGGNNLNTLVNGATVSTGIITPTDALSLDSKYDDGFATSGSIRGIQPSADPCGNAGNYDTTVSSKSCVLSFRVDVNS